MGVRIGFIGTGSIAAAHLIRLLRVPEAEIVALCDLNHDRIETTRDQVNEQATAAGGRLLDALPYTDYRTMFRSERLDAVYVCIPPFAHGTAEEAVLEANVHMFVEKPVTLNLAQADQIYGQLRDKGLLSAVGYQLRYLESMQKAKALLADRTVGMALVMRFGGTPGVPWYHLQKKSGGQLVEMATHHIDQLRYLLGEIKIVYAAAATRINQKDQPAFDIYDVNCMTLTFESGVVANFTNNLISGHGSPSTAKGVHIFCDGMTISHNLGGPLQVLSKEGTTEYPEKVDAMLAQDRAFVEAVANGQPNLIKSDYLNGVRTLAVTIAGEQSARSHQPVDVMELLRLEAPNAFRAISGKSEG